MVRMRNIKIIVCISGVMLSVPQMTCMINTTLCIGVRAFNLFNDYTFIDLARYEYVMIGIPNNKTHEICIVTKTITMNMSNTHHAVC